MHSRKRSPDSGHIDFADCLAWSVEPLLGTDFKVRAVPLDLQHRILPAVGDIDHLHLHPERLKNRNRAAKPFCEAQLFEKRAHLFCLMGHGGFDRCLEAHVRATLIDERTILPEFFVHPVEKLLVELARKQCPLLIPAAHRALLPTFGQQHLFDVRLESCFCGLLHRGYPLLGLWLG
ncbi:hypothetical protein Ptc2401_00172 [Prosthecochloris sp. CIB 2401]|nr:hypothetical protein Ptc2401_00172 [Prosthecochloris sp. CIB 2401]